MTIYLRTRRHQSVSVTALLIISITLPSDAQAQRLPTNSLARTSAPPTPSTSPNGSLVWQPLPHRATFRPVSRQPASSPPPSSIDPSPVSSSTEEENPTTPPLIATEPVSVPSRRSFATNSLSSLAPGLTSSTASTTTTTPRPATGSTRSTTERYNDNDELPTRQPSNRFRPTRAPANDEDAASVSPPSASSDNINVNNVDASSNISPPLLKFLSSSPSFSAINNKSQPIVMNRITNECYECICEASTSCNAESRCQTSDVRHTRCGLFLISYDQWLATNLSRELVTREALARDPAADERAFYECVTQRDCAERLLAIYFEKNNKDCDKDGRIDCYDLAAVHHSGLDQCGSEALLDSQFWSDFNACYGFER